MQELRVVDGRVCSVARVDAFPAPHSIKSSFISGSPAGLIQFEYGKAVPLLAWTGPEGSRKLRFPDFVTTAQDGGKVVSLTHRPPLPPGNTPGTHFC